MEFSDPLMATGAGTAIAGAAVTLFHPLLGAWFIIMGMLTMMGGLIKA